MRSRLVSAVTCCWVAIPALVVAQSTVPVPAAPPVAPPIQAPTPMPAIPTVAPTELPAVVVPVMPPTTLPPTTLPSTPDVSPAPPKAAPVLGTSEPLPNFELPPGMVLPRSTTSAATSSPSLLPPRSLPSAPPAKLTPTQIASQIAPNFNVARDYVRLTQCYGIADFMGAVTRIQASRPGATAQVVGVARSIGGLQEAMQPMVLAASTVRGERRFRTDYDAVARRGQAELATSRTPNTTMQRRLATLDACRADVLRWRGGR